MLADRIPVGMGTDHAQIHAHSLGHLFLSRMKTIFEDSWKYGGYA